MREVDVSFEPNVFAEAVNKTAGHLLHWNGVAPSITKKKLFAGAWYGPGWHHVIVDFVSALDALLSRDQARLFRILQIREEAGVLRIYYAVDPEDCVVHDVRGDYGFVYRHPRRRRDFPNNAVEALIRAAADASSVTCAFCGATGILRNHDFMAVMCDPCEEIRQAAIAERNHLLAYPSI